MGATKAAMLLIYYRHVRSILEFGVPAWNSALTMKEAAMIERVQRVAVKLIYGYGQSYDKILEKNKLEKLEDRREGLCLNFASKAAKHHKLKSWFKRKEGPGRAQYCEALTRKRQLWRSPLPYFTRLLNENNSK